jgi:hypothetical protein
MARWLSPDPVAGSIFDPQSLNRYAYVLNNPCSLIDPLGLDPTCTITIVDDQHLLSSTQLAEAQIEIINMFKQAGINVMFNQTNPDFTVTLVPQPGFWQAGVQPGDLAVNDAYLGGLFGVASSATAFTERIGKEVGPNMGTALGRVVAHEFGHFGLGLVHRKGWPGELEIGIMAQGLDWLSNGQNFDPRLHVPQLQAFCEERSQKRARAGGSGGHRGRGSWGGILIWDPTYTYECQGGDCGFTFGAYWGTYIPFPRPRRK